MLQFRVAASNFLFYSRSSRFKCEIVPFQIPFPVGHFLMQVRPLLLKDIKCSNVFFPNSIDFTATEGTLRNSIDAIHPSK